MRPVSKRFILSLVLALAGSSFAQTAWAAKVHTTPSTAKDTAQTPSSKSSASDPGSQLGNDLANKVVDNTSDPDDHVRCFFTVKQLAELRPNPTVARLTEADQSQVLTTIIQTAIAASDGELSPAQKAAFINVLAGSLDGKLVGRTPGEALAKIMDILYAIKQSTSDNPATSTKSNVNQNTTKMLSRSVPQQGTPISTADDGNKDIPLGNTSQALSAVATSARTAINKIATPADIGCAYQILSWNQSRLLFGRSVADDYIAVQITVRNVNPKEEFIVHNAMLSVDSDIHGSMGHYFESDDKFSIEGYNTAGEPLTKRGLISNGILATSTLLSVLQPIVGVATFSNAVAAFTGGVVPGFKTVLPDNQKDQLLLIANSGFSASNTKTVVGKSGAATFYTWFPAKPFLEGWWVQDCARNVVSVDPHREDPEGKESELPPVAPDTGVDKVRARYACRNVPGTSWKSVSYQKWSSITDDLFRELSLAVVAGVHVQEDNKTKPSLSDINCPKDAKGDIDLSKRNSEGAISCEITGENLGKIKKLRLENKANAVDPVRPEATVDAQDTSGNADFKVSDLAAATGAAYNVYMVAKDGTETSTGVPPLQLDPNAVTLVGPKDTSIDLGNLPDKLSLTGYHLDKLANVCFTNGSPSDSSSLTVDAVSNSSTQATVGLNPISNIAAGKWLIYPAKCASNPTAGSLAVTITGSAPPAAPPVKTVTPRSAVPARPKPNAGSHK